MQRMRIDGNFDGNYRPSNHRNPIFQRISV